jgi:hypothetical protein
LQRILLILFSSTLLWQAAPARSDERFDSLRHRAERIESLPSFLDRFIGGCQSAYERQTCEQNVQSIRKRFEGKLLVATIGDRAAGLCHTQTLGEQYRILLTPFVDGGGYALTHGSPVRQDADGRPLIPYLVLQGPLPAGGLLSFESPFRTGNVELEVVFRPEGTWKLRRKGSGFYEGVKARFVGLRLVDARTGAEIASRVLGQ